MRQVVFGGLSAIIEHIRANKLRPLAVTTERPAPFTAVCLAFEGKARLLSGRPESGTESIVRRRLR
jgi:hypothetical protein